MSNNGWKAPWADVYPNQHKPGCFYHDHAAKYGSPNVVWTENNLCDTIITQPANAWSNLAYIACSGIMWLIALKLVRVSSFFKENDDEETNDKTKNKNKKLTGKSNWLSLAKLPRSVLSLYPIFNLLTGSFSFTYHASNVATSQFFDFVGMFLVQGLILAMDKIRYRRLLEVDVSLNYRAAIAQDKTKAESSQNDDKDYNEALRNTLLFTVANCLPIPYFYMNEIKFQGIVFVHILMIVFYEFYWLQPLEQRVYSKSGGHSLIQTSLRWFYTALSLMIVAACFSAADAKRIFSHPDNHVIQGHALWHVFSALGMFCIFLHFRTRSN
jgi:hypothetical protein